MKSSIIVQRRKSRDALTDAIFISYGKCEKLVSPFIGWRKCAIGVRNCNVYPYSGSDFCFGTYSQINRKSGYFDILIIIQDLRNYK